MQEIYKEIDGVNARLKQDAALKEKLKQELRDSSDFPIGTKVLYKDKAYLVYFVNIYEKYDEVYCSYDLVVANKDGSMSKVARGGKYRAKTRELKKAHV